MKLRLPKRKGRKLKGLEKKLLFSLLKIPKRLRKILKRGERKFWNSKAKGKREKGKLKSKRKL
jgi:hypothetical protein